MLGGWSIYELPDGDRRFVGWEIENCVGKAGSRIEQSDVKMIRGGMSAALVGQNRGMRSAIVPPMASHVEIGKMGVT
jgi:hypothetical protein